MEMLETAAQQLAAAGIAVERDVPLAGHTTFKIGGPAAVFCMPATAAQLADALSIARAAGVPFYILGQGSNVLFCDEGYHGIVVCTKGVAAPPTVEGERVVAGAGATLKDICTAARDAALTGLEFAYGIPGSLGGAIYMNAGAFGGEMCNVLESVTFLDEHGTEQTLPVAELKLGYRRSIFQEKPWCILRAALRLAKGEPEEISAKMRELMQYRTDKQPLDKPSAGSAFKRPEGAFAGALIDQSGLRGFRIGGAAISEKHCGFIVNLGGATCNDVLAVADEVSAIVKDKTGYTLEKEIRVVASL